MFSDKSKEKQTVDKNSNSNQNLIAYGTKINGDFFSESVIRIDGEIDGTITSKGKIVVGKTGKITGTIKAQNAYIEGTISGTIAIKELLTLKSSAVVEGEVSLNKLEVDPGAIFNVTCSMQQENNAKKIVAQNTADFQKIKTGDKKNEFQQKQPQKLS